MRPRYAGATLLLPLLLLAAATGCQGLADSTTAGPPLVTLRGKITLSPHTPVEGNVRLALAWYPGLLNEPGGTAVPNCDFTTSLGIVSQDVEYRPNFPIDYAFDITAPPPKAAQGQLSAAGISGALGAVVAYLDGNGNGVLDPCRDDTVCADRVLGASGSVLPGGLPSDQIDSLVAYTDAIAGPGDSAGKPGFFLLRVGLNPVSPQSGILPLPSTPIDITLSAAPILRSIACDRLCVRTVGATCAVADADCALPAWPKDTNVHCGSPSSSQPPTPRGLTWLGASGCTVFSNFYAVEDGRALPPWWPCP